MPPKSHNLALLFHPKKNQKKDQKAPAGSQPKPRPKPPSIAEKGDEEQFKLPETPYQEFRLLSSSLKGWKYDVMKFDSRKPVDVLQWTQPVKLNRKDLRRQDRSTDVAKVPEAVGPMLGADGKPVLRDGKVVMVDAEGKPIPEDPSAGPSSKDKPKGPNNKKRFQKKTRQVFLVPDEVRQLQREERYPWVIEDSHPASKELWIGQLEDTSRAETHAFFMPTASDAFKFVPAHRWYKFQKKLRHEFPTDTADVESAYTQSQKRDPTAWLATLNGGKGASAQTAALFKAEQQDTKPVLSAPAGPGGRRLKAVDRPTDSLFDDEDDGRSRKQREREMGEEGDLEEQVYEEEFADDEEMAALDQDDEEAKEIEERMKREYQKANKHREAGIDEDEEEEAPTVDKSVKRMQKMIRSREGNDAYDSEEEENPYASSVEEEEEEEPVQTGPAIQPQPQQVDSRSNTPKPATNANKPTVPATANSRATSPATSPSLGGHSLVAQRATSPKIPKPKLSVNGSPAGSRATSPLPPSSRATSPLANGHSQKRKADDSGPSGSPTNGIGGSGQPKPKRPKVDGTSTVSKGDLEKLLVEWLRGTPKATTRDCIQHFNSYLVDSERKKEFSGMVKQVALLKNGFLALRPGLA